MLSPKHLFKLFVKAGKAWADDYAPSMGAAISYYTVFSLAPMLVIVVAIAGAVFGRDAVQGIIVQQLSGLMGPQGATLVEGLLASAGKSDRGLVAGLVSGVLLLVGATTVFAELQSALDRIWHVPEAKKPQGIWAILRARILSFGLILGLVFLLMVSLVVSAAVAALGSWTSGLMPGSEALLQALNLAVSLSITTLLFAMIYKLMPTIPIAWRDVWVGAFTTALLFEVGKLLIGLYLGKSAMMEPFAAAGSLVALLAWVYYGAQIFLLGAEFTKAYADEHGSKRAAQAMQATHQTKQSGGPVETPVAGSGPTTVVIEHTPRPAYRSPAQRVTETALKVTAGKLVYELVGLGVLSIIAAVLTRRRKAMEKSLKWHVKLLQQKRRLSSR
jgi:membrane protein